jgi:hypothetical protein
VEFYFHYPSVWLHGMDRNNFTSLISMILFVLSQFLYKNSGMVISLYVDRDSSVGIATGYDLNGQCIESLWGQNFPRLSRLAM